MALQDRPRKFDSDKVYEEAPVGTFAGVLTKVHDMGVKPNPFFNPNEPEGYGNQPEKHDVRLAWTINSLMSDGRPFMVSQFLSLKVTLSRKAKKRSALTELAEMLLGRTIWEIDKEIDAKSELDIASAMVGQCAMVTVKRRPNGRGVVGSVAPMPRHPDGTPMLALPDVGDALAGMVALPRLEPVVGPAEKQAIMAAAQKRIQTLGGGEALHKQMMEEIKAAQNIESAATMRVSQVSAFLAAIAAWTPIESAKDELGAEEEIPF